MLNMYVEELKDSATAGTTTITRITEDDKVLAEFNETTRSIDFGVLQDKVGEKITVHTMDKTAEIYIVDSVTWNEKHGVYELNLRPTK